MITSSCVGKKDIFVRGKNVISLLPFARIPGGFESLEELTLYSLESGCHVLLCKDKIYAAVSPVTKISKYHKEKDKMLSSEHIKTTRVKFSIYTANLVNP
jgi:hypothetical protein